MIFSIVFFTLGSTEGVNTSAAMRNRIVDQSNAAVNNVPAPNAQYGENFNLGFSYFLYHCLIWTMENNNRAKGDNPSKPMPKKMTPMMLIQTMVKNQMEKAVETVRL